MREVTMANFNPYKPPEAAVDTVTPDFKMSIFSAWSLVDVAIALGLAYGIHRGVQGTFEYHAYVKTLGQKT